MPPRIKPILALKCPKEMTLDEFIDKVITYPCLATPKIDFIRLYTTNTIRPNLTCNDYTRSRKEIPNRYIHTKITTECPAFLDGELGVGTTFQDGTSGIMSYEGNPNFTYYVFDCRINEPWSYESRMDCLSNKFLPSFCVKLLPRLIHDKEGLLHFEKYAVEELGAEGICMRPPSSPYIVGTADNRATMTRPYLVALCRWDKSEAIVIGFEEEMRNLNEPETNYLGRNIRPSHREGMIPNDTLGSLILRDIYTGVIFNCGSGFTQQQKQEIWQNKQTWLNKIVRYKWKKHGSLKKPRIPIYDGIRDERDMSI